MKGRGGCETRAVCPAQIAKAGGQWSAREAMAEPAAAYSRADSFIGVLAGLSAPVNTYQFMTKNVRLHGIETGSREMFEEMNRFIESRRLKPVIDRTFAFEEAREALKYLESGAHFGKIVIEF